MQIDQLAARFASRVALAGAFRLGENRRKLWLRLRLRRPLPLNRTLGNWFQKASKTHLALQMVCQRRLSGPKNTQHGDEVSLTSPPYHVEWIKGGRLPPGAQIPATQRAAGPRGYGTIDLEAKRWLLGVWTRPDEGIEHV